MLGKLLFCIRLVKNPENGQPKGFGFCEFRDPQTAESAIRNLHNYEFGGRPLRVDCAANQSDKFDRFPPPMNDSNSNRPGMQAAKQQPNPVELLAGMVDSMTPDRMVEILSYLKGIASANSHDMNFLVRNFSVSFASELDRELRVLTRTCSERSPHSSHCTEYSTLRTQLPAWLDIISGVSTRFPFPSKREALHTALEHRWAAIFKNYTAPHS